MNASTGMNSRARSGYVWAQRGDINAFFGLMLDNIGGMILMASLLVGFNLPRQFVLTRMIPGTAVGVLVGDLIYTVMAFRLARRTGRSDVTAMPLGLDTPSTFGAVLFIIGPSYQAALKRGLEPEAAASHAWFIGIAMLFASGAFKVLCAPMSAWVRRIVPRAGLLGSLAAIALVLISFLPMLDIAAQPVAGMVALGLMLATLTARWELPKQFPGAMGAVVVGCLVYYGIQWLGWGVVAGPEVDRPSWALRAVDSRPDRGLVDVVRDLVARSGWLPTDGDPARAGHGRRRHRLHGKCRSGWRRLPDSPDYRRGRLCHDSWGDLRRRDPDHSVHRTSRLQGDGGPGSLHPGHCNVRRGRRHSSDSSTGSSSSSPNRSFSRS